MYKVRNWRQFQHYRDRNPPWIKLHFSLLSSPDWVMLDDASRALAIACMLIASRNDGEVPADPDYLQRVAYLNSRPNFKPLIKCGFLECASTMLADASTLQANARPETETETETETENKTLAQDKPARKVNGAEFDAFWNAYPKKRNKAEAIKAWTRLKPDAELYRRIMSSLEAHKRAPDWTKDGGQFIPYPASWLRAGGFDDVLDGQGKPSMFAGCINL